MARRVIDFHAHLGDIFDQRRNVTFLRGVKPGSIWPNPYEGKYKNIFVEHEKNHFTGPLIKNVEDLPVLIEYSQQMCWANTLENVGKNLDEGGVDYICMFPVMPCNSFDEMYAASLIEPRIIPFASADFRLPTDEMVADLVRQINTGAKGLKLHPVLQMTCLLDPKVEAATKVFGEAGLPIISHCGGNNYYIERDLERNTPEFGDVKYMIEYAKKFPEYNIIGAHGGGLMGGEMEILAEGTKGLPNFYVDTTFRSASDIKKLIELFGEDRVLYGTDAPWATEKGSIAEVVEACGGNAELEDKILYANAARLLHMA